MANPSFGSPQWDAKYNIKPLGQKGPPVARKQSKNRKWIQQAIGQPGALHQQMGVPQGQKIPPAKVAAAASSGGVLGQRARLAQTLAKLKGG